MEYDVSVVPCSSYEEEECRKALLSVLEPLGGLSFVKEGMRIAIKANLVTALKPDAAATTNDVLLTELTKLLLEKGAQVIIGDSPGGLYTAPYLEVVYRVTGMHRAEKAGAKLNRDFRVETAHFEGAKTAHDFEFTSYLKEADAIIDFCKLKSHGMMTLSNGAKNMFGVIPGTRKPEYHYRFSDPADFADMIIDLNEYFKPVLTITDAVVSMEGNGPTAGTPRKTGFLAASKSPHKLDLYCAEVLGLSAAEVPTLQAAIRRGLIPEKAEELSVFGEKPVVSDFALAAEGCTTRFFTNAKTPFGKALGTFAEKALAPHPKAEKAECIGCKKCAQICPAKAIEMKAGIPSIDRKKCIGCFCCQEFCPKGAMKAKRPFIAKILS